MIHSRSSSSPACTAGHLAPRVSAPGTSALPSRHLPGLATTSSSSSSSCTAGHPAPRVSCSSSAQTTDQEYCGGLEAPRYKSEQGASPARRAATFLPILFIRLYQLTLARFLGGQCRFHPTCSEYAIAALREWGLLRGLWLTSKRLARCNPFVKGGYDPVPINEQLERGEGKR